jgi:UDP-N-acetylmuramate: L-alanyl-gamma-D-glutamyl-meso-diaminopimelate ligase
MNVHFIAIGGAAMHNLALAMHQLGHQVTGSDDEIFEPSKGRLAKAGLLPSKMGWDADRITTDLDAIILGMHARKDNPELVKALETGLRVYSYPEFIFEQSTQKTRVVIAGSHGKTTITSMILHVLKKLDRDFDYLVGAQIEGFETMVRLSDAPVIVLEGDEYLSSPIDRRPKFHLYHPQIALISGIAWDHINVFPTWENYKEQFSLFINSLEKGAKLIYCKKDEVLNKMVGDSSNEIERIGYQTPEHRIENGKTILSFDGKEFRISVFGDHNLQNMSGAQLVCAQLGIERDTFYKAIADFTGASRRLEEIGRNENTVVYKDFAHSPSKLVATVQAVKQQWPNRKLVACMELHTFSSLTKEFLLEYKDTMKEADVAIVFYKEETLMHKKLAPISKDDVKVSFGRNDLIVYTSQQEIEADLKTRTWSETNLLLMSSGNFGGMNVDVFGAEIASKGQTS